MSPNFADYLSHATVFTLDKNDPCTRDQQLRVSKLGESLYFDELCFEELNNNFELNLWNCENPLGAVNFVNVDCIVFLNILRLGKRHAFGVWMTVLRKIIGKSKPIVRNTVQKGLRNT